MWTYCESRESQALYQLNEKIISMKYSEEYQFGLKYYMLRNALKRYDKEFFKQHISAKIRKRKYNSHDGNSKYHDHSREAASFSNKPRLCVYSCIVGDYDTPFEPFFSDGIDFVMFTDQQINEDSIWQKFDITKLDEYGKESKTMFNRRIKLNPHVYLKDYDYTIYIDGNIRIVADLYPLIINMGDAAIALHLHANRDCIYQEVNGINLLKKANKADLDKQIFRYKNEGFPEHFGLFQNSIIICNHKNDEADKLMERWWAEYEITQTRDQLSLPYVLWKYNYEESLIHCLGDDVYKNARFLISEHNTEI